MKRLIPLAALFLVAGFAFAEEAADNAFVNDFTTGMGKWTLNKAEGEPGATGLKITKTDKLGGIMLESNKKTDLSAYKTIDFDMDNGGDKPITFAFKIKSGKSGARTDDKAAGTLAPGAHTVSFTLAGGTIDLKEVNYIKIWTLETGDVKLTIKNANFAPAAGAASQPTSAPATAPAK